MSKLVNRAKVFTTTTGTGTITLGAAISGYQTFASAGVVNADVVRYVIEDGNAWEIGNGTYTATGTTLARSLIQSSTGSLLNLTGNAQVYVSGTAEDFNELAPLASPALTGTPTAPTAAVGTNTTQIATTAFVNAEIANDITGKADLASPALTGTPTAPTAAVSTNTTQIATTAFVNAEIANDAPTKTGGGASGSWGISVTGTSANVTGTVAVANGGTGATDAGTARTNLNVPTRTGGDASGTWGISISGNAATATSLSTDRTNWSTNGTIDDVVGQLAWKNYGNNHTIFDASAGTSPNGGAVNNTNAAVAWTATYPTLMGWNGASTYGVRVDSARVADSATTAGTITSQANSATITASTAANGNQIVLRDGNADDYRRYGFAEYFNMSHGVSGATGDTIFYSSTDNYIRKNNATGLRASLNVPTRTGGDASGTWGINVTGSSGSTTGNAATVTTVTTAQVGSATAGLATGAVGTYAYLAIAGDLDAGSTYAGSSLFYAGIIHWGMTANTRQDTTNTWRSSTSPAGTWRAMGTTRNDTGGAGVGTVCLRIS